MKKIIKITFINILLIGLIFCLSEFLVYRHHVNTHYDKHPRNQSINKFSYTTYLPSYMTDLEKFFDNNNNIYAGRKPDGLEYQSKNPIVIFGCSYAFGQYLNYNQTLSYKLANSLKRSVYNRGISGGSFPHLYMQANSESLYKTIPNTDTVIYIMIHDHARRMFLNYFDVLDLHVLPHYSIKNNTFVMDNYNNKALNFFNSLYTVKAINHAYADNYFYNPHNAEKLTDIITLYFTESRKKLEEKWNKKLTFHILLYEDWGIRYKDLLTKKLKQNGFIVTSTNDLTDEDLTSEKYMMQDNYHPTEAAWDLLTPKIIEKFGLK